MFTNKFTVSGSSLALLKAGEQGVVTRFRNADANTSAKLQAMGITPGISITLEQHKPNLIVTAGKTRLALDREICRSIYVRISRH